MTFLLTVLESKIQYSRKVLVNLTMYWQATQY